MVKCSPKYLIAQFLVEPEADSATALIFAGCFSPLFIFTSCSNELAFLPNLLMFLGLVFQDLKASSSRMMLFPDLNYSRLALSILQLQVPSLGPSLVQCLAELTKMLLVR